MNTDTATQPATKTKQPTLFVVGDWVMFEFQLAQVKETDGARVTSASTDFFSHGSYDMVDLCFRLSSHVNAVSSHFADMRRRLHACKLSNALNHPDLHRWLVQRWAEACADEGKAGEVINATTKHVAEIERRCQEVMTEKIDGVRVFGRT